MSLEHSSIISSLIRIFSLSSKENSPIFFAGNSNHICNFAQILIIFLNFCNSLISSNLRTEILTTVSYLWNYEVYQLKNLCHIVNVIVNVSKFSNPMNISHVFYGIGVKHTQSLLYENVSVAIIPLLFLDYIM